MNDPAVDAYIERSTQWPDEMRALRSVLARCDLIEQIKWGKPCYRHGDANVVIVQEMKDFLALMFFKGALLSDPAGVLGEQGPNSRSARRITFTSVEEVIGLGDTVAAYVAQAIEVEEAGLEVEAPTELILVDELQQRLDRDEALRIAFEALTPGRRREYNLHISGAKQAKTREARIDRYTAKILDGKGLRDR